jgi:hypothetical protein
MALEKMSPEEREVILRCLRFVADSGSLEGEFETRVGVPESEIRGLLRKWPAVDERANDCSAGVAINSALNEVCNGLNIGDVKWLTWFAVPRETVMAVFRRWRSLKVDQP